MNFSEFQRHAHSMASGKGFWEGNPPNIPEKIALIHSELSEALEEYRDGQMATYHVDGKPEGFGIELADAVIRIADLAEYCGLDLAALIQEKMQFNATRPYKHGKMV